MRLGLVSRLTTPGMSSVLAQPSRVERPPARPIAYQSSAKVLDRDVVGACSRAPGPGCSDRVLRLHEAIRGYGAPRG
jgi:hypothetical protein